MKRALQVCTLTEHSTDAQRALLVSQRLMHWCLQMWTSPCHTGTDGCSCRPKYPGNAIHHLVVSNPACTRAGHSTGVARVEFSDDGAQVFSWGINGKVRASQTSIPPPRQCCLNVLQAEFEAGFHGL